MNMHKFDVIATQLAAAAVVFAAFTAPVTAGPDAKKAKDVASAQVAPAQDIVATAVAAGSFKTLVAAVQAAGLAETLQSKGPFTVFAPTDDAFAKLPKGTLEELLKPENKDKLAGILTYHVVSGRVMAKDVAGASSVKTVNGQSLAITVRDGAVRVDGANVVKTDIVCSNGVIHVIDSVILPK
jgi:uncharacterized surface protein with fasciclin (FAS1) repeats